MALLSKTPAELAKDPEWREVRLALFDLGQAVHSAWSHLTHGDATLVRGALVEALEDVTKALDIIDGEGAEGVAA